MAQIQKGTTYSTGDQVTAANLNALADAAILLPGAITDQTAKTVPLAADTILLHSAADTALRKSTLTQLFSNATGIPISTGISGLGTGIAAALAVNTGSAGAPVLFNGALGTPSSGTVTNLTGTASININGTVGATTANTGQFTTLFANGLIKYNGSSAGELQFNSTSATTQSHTISSYYNTGAAFAPLNISAGTITSFVNGSNISVLSSTGLAVTGTLSTLATNGVNVFESAGISSVGLQFKTNSTNRFKIETPSASADLVFYSGGTTEVGRFSSTGLALTGQFNLPKQNLSALQTGTANTGTIQFYQSSGDSFKRFLDIVAGDDGGSGVASHIRFLTASGNGTITERVRIDGSGNVGIGATSPATKLEVVGPASVTSFTGTSNLGVRITGSTSTNDYSGIDFSASTQPPRARIGAYYSNSGSYLVFGTSNSYASGITNSAMTIDYNGNVGIGTTSPSTRFHVNGDSTFNQGSGYVFSITGGSLSGSQQFRHWVSSTNYYIFNDSNQGVYLAYGGTSWTSNSDERNKDIIEPITDAVDKVSSLRAIIGKYKTDAEGTRRSFLIAQDVQKILPEAVSIHKNQDDETEYLGVAYTDLIPLLVASIKELTQRVAALESN